MNPVTRWIALFKAWLSLAGPSTVHPTIVTRRAQVCSRCPHNQPLPVWKRIPQPRNHQLHNRQCNLCGCPLAQKTLMPIHLVRNATPWPTFLNLPDSCWIKKSVEISTEPGLPSPT